MTQSVRVHVPTGVDPVDADELLEDIRSLGLAPKRAPVARGPETWPWVLMLAVEPFVQHLIEKAADDAYTRLKGVVQKARTNQEPHDVTKPTLILYDEAGLQIEFGPDLPDEAYRQLFTMTRPPAGRLRYDRDHGTWTVGDSTSA